MNKKWLAALGIGAAGAAFFAWLAGRAGAKPLSEVLLKSNPVNTVILVDDKYEVATPQVLKLPNGWHTFKAVTKTPNYLTVTYGLDYWTLNGKAVSYNERVMVNITGPTAITAQYRLYQAGRYPSIEV